MLNYKKPRDLSAEGTMKPTSVQLFYTNKYVIGIKLNNPTEIEVLQITATVINFEFPSKSSSKD